MNNTSNSPLIDTLLPLVGGVAIIGLVITGYMAWQRHHNGGISRKDRKRFAATAGTLLVLSLVCWIWAGLRAASHDAYFKPDKVLERVEKTDQHEIALWPKSDLDEADASLKARQEYLTQHCPSAPLTERATCKTEQQDIAAARAKLQMAVGG